MPLQPFLSENWKARMLLTWLHVRKAYLGTQMDPNRTSRTYRRPSRVVILHLVPAYVWRHMYLCTCLVARPAQLSASSKGTAFVKAFNVSLGAFVRPKLTRVATDRQARASNPGPRHCQCLKLNSLYLYMGDWTGSRQIHMPKGAHRQPGLGFESHGYLSACR